MYSGIFIGCFILATIILKLIGMTYIAWNNLYIQETSSQMLESFIILCSVYNGASAFDSRGDSIYLFFQKLFYSANAVYVFSYIETF